MSGLTYTEAVVVGGFQGITELFPVSSLGHSVLVPALAGGRWAEDLNVSAPESPYLAFIVGLHVATAAALLVFFWRDWVRILAGFGTSLRHRRIHTPAERLAWLIVVATIPVGIAGVALEHLFRTTLGRPVPAAAFLLANGAVLLAGERLRRRVRVPAGVAATGDAGGSGQHSGGLDESELRLAQMPVGKGLFIGSARDLGAASRDQPLRGDDGGRVAARAQPRRRRAVFIPAGHTGDSGRRGVQDSRLVRAAGRRDRWAGARRQCGVVRQRLLRGAFLDPVLSYPHADTVRCLLRGRRCRRADLVDRALSR